MLRYPEGGSFSRLELINKPYLEKDRAGGSLHTLCGQSPDSCQLSVVLPFFRVTIYSTARRHVAFFSWENPTLLTQEVKIILASRLFSLMGVTSLHVCKNQIINTV